MLCVRDGGDAREPRSCQHETPPPHPAGQSLVLQLPRAASWQQGGPPQLSLTSLSSPSTGWGTTRTLQLFGNGTGGGGHRLGAQRGLWGGGGTAALQEGSWDAQRCLHPALRVEEVGGGRGR